jgi:pyruvate,orthophosphate dikinase
VTEHGDLVVALDHRHPSGTDRVALLGGKGAGLSVMATDLGLPVPPGFTITVAAGRAFRDGGWPDGLDEELAHHLAALEARLGRVFGGDPPLLVSVRSGAPISMPGMLDTVLDVGLHPAAVAALAAETGDEAFARDCERRLVTMFGTVVHGLDRALFDGRDAPGARRAFEQATGTPFPDDPHAQLRAAVEAVFRSWDSDRARAFRAVEGIADDGPTAATAVTVQAMVFGNRAGRSGTGVAFSRDPVDGARGLTGDWLDGAQGEDVVSGTRATEPLSALAIRMPDVHADLVRTADLCEAHLRDLVDLEFTVEDGRLWLLQVRPGRRSPGATVRVAVDLVAEGLISQEEAVGRVGVDALAHVLADDRVDAAAVPIAVGLAASPGTATGDACFSADAALDAADAGRPVILVRPETSPEDVHGMSVAEGILTARGGLVSHAAVVARSWGKPAVVGCAELVIDATGVTLAGHPIAEGDTVTIDGATGAVHLEAVGRTATAVPEAVDALLAIADAVRGTAPAVRTGAPDPDDDAIVVPAAGSSPSVARTAARDRRAADPDTRLVLLDPPPTEAWMDLAIELQVAEVRADDAAIPLVRLGLAHAALRAAHAAG